MMKLDFSSLYDRAKKFYAFLSVKGGINLPPFHTFLEITYRCNLRCEFCQFLDILRKKTPESLRERELSLSEIKRVIDQIPNHTLITITGGEPFLREDILDIVEYACLRHKVHIISNATLITEQVAKKLNKLGSGHVLRNGLFWMSISLHGDKEIHDALTGVSGSFQKTTNAIKNIQKYRIHPYPKLNLQTVINKKNVAYLSRIVEIAYGLNVRVCNFMVQDVGVHFERDKMLDKPLFMYAPTPPYIKEDLLAQSLKKAHDKALRLGIKLRYQLGGKGNIIKYYSRKINIENYVCYAPWSTIGISAYGDVGLCFSCSFGNIKKQKLKEIWNNKRLTNFRRLLIKKGAFPGCAGCCFLQHK